MIRTALASPWLPLLYWAAVVLATISGARHECLKRRLGHHEFQGGLSEPTPAPTREHSLASQLHLAKEAVVPGFKPTHFWELQISVLQRNGSLCSWAGDGPRNKQDADFAQGANFHRFADHHAIDSRRSAGTKRGDEIGDSMQDQRANRQCARKDRDNPRSCHRRGRVVHGKDSHYGRKQSGWVGTT